MKTYLYNEQGYDSPIEITEKQILEQYWEYWVTKMQNINRSHQISEQNCIDDWVVVNWAWRKLESYDGNEDSFEC